MPGQTALNTENTNYSGASLFRRSKRMLADYVVALDQGDYADVAATWFADGVPVAIRPTNIISPAIAHDVAIYATQSKQTLIRLIRYKTWRYGTPFATRWVAGHEQAPVPTAVGGAADVAATAGANAGATPTPTATTNGNALRARITELEGLLTQATAQVITADGKVLVAENAQRVSQSSFRDLVENSKHERDGVIAMMASVCEEGCVMSLSRIRDTWQDPGLLDLGATEIGTREAGPVADHERRIAWEMRRDIERRCDLRHQQRVANITARATAEARLSAPIATSLTEQVRKDIVGGQVERGDNCVICYETLHSEPFCVILPGCLHTFHRRCFATNCRQGHGNTLNSRSCPVCRNVVRPFIREPFCVGPLPEGPPPPPPTAEEVADAARATLTQTLHQGNYKPTLDADLATRWRIRQANRAAMDPAVRAAALEARLATAGAGSVNDGITPQALV